LNSRRLLVLFAIVLGIAPLSTSQTPTAVGTVTIVGIDSLVPPTNAYDFGTVTISVGASGAVTTSYGNSGFSPSSASNVAAALCSAVNSTPSTSGLVQCTGSSGPIITLAALAAGPAGNGITLEVSAQTSFPQSNQSAFSGSTTSGVLALQAQTRSFQMTLWGDPFSPPLDADLAFFGEGALQPNAPTRSIIYTTDWQAADPAAAWNATVASMAASGQPYDFNRILAVVVDEPYWDTVGTPDWSNPCRDARINTVQTLYQKLQALAAAVRQTPNASRVRFWINFSEPEVQWMMDSSLMNSNCPPSLNGPFVDVISMDKYWKPFPGPCQIVAKQPANCVQSYYDWMLGHRASPGQQVALIPGTFVRTQNGVQIDQGQQQAALLSGFFNYANGINQTCDFPPGNLGFTGNFDRCPVWVVAGFPGQSFMDTNYLWHGELDTDPMVQPIQQVWRAELGLVVRQPAVHGALVSDIINTLLN
jgi:hypothetical protein